jgi:hypothetical protein
MIDIRASPASLLGSFTGSGMAVRTLGLAVEVGPELPVGLRHVVDSSELEPGKLV